MCEGPAMVSRKRPNVIFIIADQHRWDFLGRGRNGITFTPALDRLASQGVLFQNAYCTSPLCSPSRAAIASGRYGMNSGCFTNLHQLPPGAPGFVHQLRQAGYHTCAIGKTHMEIHAYDSDLTSESHRDFMDSLGWCEAHEVSGNGMLKTGICCAYSEWLKARGRFEEVLAFYRQWRYFLDKQAGGLTDFQSSLWSLPEEIQETSWIGRTALQWLQARSGDKPFFLHLGFAAPHSPTEPLSRCLEPYRGEEETRPWGGTEAPAWLTESRQGYRAMISQVDCQIGQILDWLAAAGELENTLVVYTADHGEMAGDHGLIGKTCFFEGSMHVPLLVAGPGVCRGAESPALVELLDLGRTICDLCGVGTHALDQGRSLAALLAGNEEKHRDTVYGEMGCDRMLYDGRHKLMWGDPQSDTRQLGRLHLDKPVTVPASPPRLYDLREDPREERNLLDGTDHDALLIEMLGKLLMRLNENIQPRANLDRGEYRPL